MDDWAKQRLAELQARAPVKREKTEPFAMVRMARAAAACTAMNCPKAMVWMWLVHQARKTGSGTVAVPNVALAKWGVSRKVKSLALRQLEAAGLIAIERPSKKTPVVTLLNLSLIGHSTVSSRAQNCFRLGHTVPFLSYPFLSNQ